jgi:hypothetical protein
MEDRVKDVASGNAERPTYLQHGERSTMASTRQQGADRRHWLSLRTLRQAVLALLWVAVAVLSTIAVVSFVLWQRDLREIRSIVATRIDENASQAEIVQGAREFLKLDVGYGKCPHGCPRGGIEPDYFLLPVFHFMRPTALQIIRGGGACAHRTRLFIVILRQYGIKARKRPLHSREGRPVHVVAEVQTEPGPLYVDLLYNIAHVRDDGTPLTLEALAHEDTLRASIESWIARGSEQAKLYRFDEYQFTDVRTINWNKNAPLRWTYKLLTLVMGETRAKAFPRPYLSEEPALMVIVICVGTSLVLLFSIWVVSRSGRTAMAHATPGASRPQF